MSKAAEPEWTMAKRPKAKDLTVGRMDPNDKRVIGQQVVARILELNRRDPGYERR